MAKKLIYTIIVISIFLAPKITHAQITIEKFYKDGTNTTEYPDWIQIKNNTDSEYNLNGHSIEDTAASNPIVHKWESNFFIAANSSCRVEAGNRLNKDGDVIYLKQGVTQIDCVGYGNKNEGECDRVAEPTSETDYSESNCYRESTPQPTLTPTPTPKPEVKTPEPTLPPNKNVSQISEQPNDVALTVTISPQATNTPVVSASAESQVLAVQEENKLDSDEFVEEKAVKNSIVADISIFTGIVLIISSLAWSIYYNKNYFEQKTSF